MLVPIQTFMALSQFQQQQQATDSTQQATPSSSLGSGDNEVVQLDGTFPSLGVAQEVGGVAKGGGATVGEKEEARSCGMLLKGKSSSRHWIRNVPGIVQLDGSSAGHVDSSSDEDSDEEDSSEVSRGEVRG